MKFFLTINCSTDKRNKFSLAACDCVFSRAENQCNCCCEWSDTFQARRLRRKRCAAWGWLWRFGTSIIRHNILTINTIHVYILHITSICIDGMNSWPLFHSSFWLGQPMFFENQLAPRMIPHDPAWLHVYFEQLDEMRSFLGYNNSYIPRVISTLNLPKILDLLRQRCLVMFSSSRRLVHPGQKLNPIEPELVFHVSATTTALLKDIENIYVSDVYLSKCLHMWSFVFEIIFRFILLNLKLERPPQFMRLQAVFPKKCQNSCYIRQKLDGLLEDRAQTSPPKISYLCISEIPIEKYIKTTINKNQWGITYNLQKSI